MVITPRSARLRKAVGRAVAALNRAEFTGGELWKELSRQGMACPAVWGAIVAMRREGSMIRVRGVTSSTVWRLASPGEVQTRLRIREWCRHLVPRSSPLPTTPLTDAPGA